MRKLFRITALLLCMVLLASGICFAAGAAIVSPAENTIVYADNFLLSVKLTEKITVKITVYEEMEASGKNQVSANVAAYTKSDLAIIANKTVSVEKNQLGINATYKLSDGSVAKVYSGRVIMNTVSFTNTKDVGFYTKQISNLKPGLYRVKVEKLDSNKNVIETLNSFVAVKEKTDTSKGSLFDDKESTTAVKYIQNLLKNIFD